MPTVPTKTTGFTLNFGTMPTLTGGQSWVGVEFYDASTGGNLIVGGTLPTPQTLYTGYDVDVPVGALLITVSGIVIGDAKALAVLNLLLGNGTPATVYAQMMQVMSVLGGSAGTVFPGGVSRFAATNNTSNFPNATMV